MKIVFKKISWKVWNHISLMLIAFGGSTPASARIPEDKKPTDTELRIPHKSVESFVKKVVSEKARNLSNI